MVARRAALAASKEAPRGGGWGQEARPAGYKRNIAIRLYVPCAARCALLCLCLKAVQLYKVYVYIRAVNGL